MLLMIKIPKKKPQFSQPFPQVTPDAAATVEQAVHKLLASL